MTTEAATLPRTPNQILGFLQIRLDVETTELAGDAAAACNILEPKDLGGEVSGKAQGSKAKLFCKRFTSTFNSGRVSNN
ncbi:RNA polymerase sigma-70 factor [Nodularia spumigena CCY9414]|nr:RNA polymerase sigma-70 factor [Nodularia spumigena CCY9414]